MESVAQPVNGQLPQKSSATVAADSQARFIDLFAGCGGLSLGLMQSGWTGMLAIEKDKDAFQTFKHNLLDGEMSGYVWPNWMPKRPFEICQFLNNYEGHLRSLRGVVGLVVGGPPCQGFSQAGRREYRDPRNQAFQDYLRVIEVVKPLLLLFENVPGISSRFARSQSHQTNVPREPVSAIIKARLENDLGYAVFSETIRAVDYGVAQLRPRHFLIGIQRSIIQDGHSECSNPFNLLKDIRPLFLKSKGLSPSTHVSAGEAISDLEIRNTGRLMIYPSNSAFQQIRYCGPDTYYQELLHRGMNGVSPNSLRLARHRQEIVERFSQLILECRKGINLSRAERAKFGIRKSSIKILEKTKPSPTLTTLPDDIVHYSDPRILTVRENARLQSFPDWFEFKGKYTTGGQRRSQECPRYTQVANAVPPFLAEALGQSLRILMRNLTSGRCGCISNR